MKLERLFFEKRDHLYDATNLFLNFDIIVIL